MAINEINSDLICVFSLILLFPYGLVNFLATKNSGEK
jgi:hypothetical protein